MKERIGPRHLIFPHPEADYVEYETVNGTECVAWYDAEENEWIISFSDEDDSLLTFKNEYEVMTALVQWVPCLSRKMKWILKAAIEEKMDELIRVKAAARSGSLGETEAREAVKAEEEPALKFMLTLVDKL
ncbi:hypothetical protein [Staphylospora marina]|uniref:hypothetical protein n=1 Tax=Staphylospora marina TaxID=2490858 RepID=UPI000F5BFFC8|nr:hypothetical protein [Staphylospora marina]